MTIDKLLFFMKPSNVSLLNVELSCLFCSSICNHSICKNHHKVCFQVNSILTLKTLEQRETCKKLLNFVTKSNRSITIECGVKLLTLEFRLKKKELKSPNRKTVLVVIEENEKAK